MTCPQHADGEHAFLPGHAQFVTNDGRRMHPTVRESWRSGMFCRCGAEAFGEEAERARAALRETAKVRALQWGREAGEQGRLWE